MSGGARHRKLSGRGSGKLLRAPGGLLGLEQVWIGQDNGWRHVADPRRNKWRFVHVALKSALVCDNGVRLSAVQRAIRLRLQ
ncbi:hypothetical protein A5709_15235 [Mycobacterium sp. E1386]|nr:hypothetical protein A5709_15235 [Mycobacterium sp. E1386]